MKRLFSLLVFVQFIISINAQIPTSGLSMYLPFSGDANDASGNGNNGTVTNAVLTTDRFGNVDKAYAFNGNSKISVPDAASLRPSSMSLSVWVKTSQQGGVSVVAGKSVGSGTCESYVIYLDSRNTLSPVYGAVSCSNSVSYSPFLISNPINSVWCHLVYTVDDANDRMKLYVDGILVKEDVWYSPIAYDETPFMLGVEKENGVDDFYFNGCIDDVRLYGQALSDAEVKNLYDAESVPPIQCSNIAAGALNFDGIDDKVELGWLNFNEQVFTIEMWLKPGSTQQTYADIIDLNHRTGINWVCQYQGNNTYLFGAQVSGVFFTLNSDEWQHLAMVKEDKTIRVYVNGLLVGSVNHDPPVLYDGNQSLRLGAWGGGGRNWNGSIDEVRIWNRVLCENEIQARKDCELSGSESGLLAYYNFNQGFVDCINASEATLLDAKGLHNGTLQNFALTGVNSNFITGQVSGGCQTLTSSTLYTFYKDADGDGFGDPSVSAQSCELPPTYVTNTLDCDDTKASVYPDAPEICDGLDNNCNGSIDEGVTTTYYADADSDGFGNPSVSIQACNQSQGYVTNNTDCDDTRANVNPNVNEICDGLDNDCNGIIDEGVKSTFYADSDGDGYGNPLATTQACSAPIGYVSNNTDCDDTKASVKPNATEICGNGIDDNCNGQIDENCSNCPIATALSTTNITASSAQLNWAAIVNPDQWQVQYKTTNNGSKWIDVSGVTKDARSVTINNLLKNQNYNWHLRARCGKVWTEYSVSISFKTLSSNQSLVANTVNTANFNKTFFNSKTGIIRIYPNPVSEKLFIEFDQAIKTGSLKIYDLQGKLILSNILQEGSLTHQVNIKDLKTISGIYMIQLNIDDELIVEKLIVNN
jgi:Concanavalin A-like lectin/glucanases superfamily/Secretion system C-terminal sorting domain/Putative metal-binding motif/Fibronectin type III domain